MGLACSNIRLLTLTARKADCEYNILTDSMEKMESTREQSALDMEYYAKLKGKTISYYDDGQYNMMTYQYLMGYNNVWSNIGVSSRDGGKVSAIKDDNSMILTDSNGFVVMNDYYAGIMKKVLGNDYFDSSGRGGTFSSDKIAELIAAAVDNVAFPTENIQKVIDGEKIYTGHTSSNKLVISGDVTSTNNQVTTTGQTNEIKKVIDFYYPIFLAASANGCTTEYNKDMARNDSYLSDALVTGIFQLEQVNSEGGYDPDASLSYFCLSGRVVERTDSNVREEITAWYNAEKARISEKEDWLDLEIRDLSTELEAINTEIESVKSLIDDDIQNNLNFGNS